jgi:hypothetical protein
VKENTFTDLRISTPIQKQKRRRQNKYAGHEKKERAHRTLDIDDMFSTDSFLYNVHKQP